MRYPFGCACFTTENMHLEKIPAGKTALRFGKYIKTKSIPIDYSDTVFLVSSHQSCVAFLEETPRMRVPPGSNLMMKDSLNTVYVPVDTALQEGERVRQVGYYYYDCILQISKLQVEKLKQRY